MVICSGSVGVPLGMSSYCCCLLQLISFDFFFSEMTVGLSVCLYVCLSVCLSVGMYVVVMSVNYYLSSVDYHLSVDRVMELDDDIAGVFGIVNPQRFVFTTVVPLVGKQGVHCHTVMRQRQGHVASPVPLPCSYFSSHFAVFRAVLSVVGPWY